MRLQKQISRVVDEKEYAKWIVVIPPKYITELGWREGEELKPCVDRRSLVDKLDFAEKGTSILLSRVEPNGSQKMVFTIGYEGRESPQFVEALRGKKLVSSLT